MLARRLLAGVVLAGLLAPAARAEVKLHPLFSDHMVLQRGVEVPVFGTAAPGEKVAVSLERAASSGTRGQVQSQVATADDRGAWLVKFPAQTVGPARTITVKGEKNELTVKDVLVGDVWICSGQSNMQWEFWRLNKDDQGKKVSAAANNPNLRLFTVPRRPSPKPEADFPVQTIDRDKDHKATFGKWELATPETVLEFSAVAYYFGRDLQKALDVPIGLIATNWGGTVAEAWTSQEGLAAEPSLKYLAENFERTTSSYDAAKAEANYKAALEKWKKDAAQAKKDGKPAPRPPVKLAAGGVHQNTPTALFNGMIHPLLKFPVKGAIWYQGESNAGRAYEYRTLMPTLIKDWRKHWKSELPFFMVQLAPFRGGPSGVDYAELRDAQFHTTKVLPKVGIAIITDAGDETDIHPQEKEPAGARLALAARAIAYGEKIEYSGPVFKSVKFEGDKAILSFDHVGGGLVAKGSELTGFTIAGEDRVFHPAKAEIKGDTVVVSSEKVAKPVAVRFGWVNFAKPELNFFNKAGLPAAPFRTDDWPLTTAPKAKK